MTPEKLERATQLQHQRRSITTEIANWENPAAMENLRWYNDTRVHATHWVPQPVSESFRLNVLAHLKQKLSEIDAEFSSL